MPSPGVQPMQVAGGFGLMMAFLIKQEDGSKAG